MQRGYELTGCQGYLNSKRSSHIGANGADLNRQPTVYKTVALPLSYIGKMCGHFYFTHRAAPHPSTKLERYSNMRFHEPKPIKPDIPPGLLALATGAFPGGHKPLFSGPRDLNSRNLDFGLPLIFMERRVRFELTAFCLEDKCSATELHPQY